MKFSDKPMHVLKSEEDATKELFSEEPRLDHLPTIPDFFVNREIFITGGSGFMGKVLIEKLLRSCPGIKAIYVLLRPKKGKSIEERMKAITDLPLFRPLRDNLPHVLHKLIPINGDVAELELGLSSDDSDRMKNVSIIYHSAASVRFDDSLKYAVFMNTRGTRELMKFAEKLENLKVLLHVSTTYSNSERHLIEEKIYPPIADWQKTIEICEQLDDDTVNTLTSLYMNFAPNTYTFSKNLAEHIVEDYKDKVPVVLFRPSIVISSMKEPFPGWVDNFNGPVGLLVGSGIGVTRTMYCNPDNIADFTPVDVCIKAMIGTSWKRAFEPSGSLPVYNCTSSKLVSVTFGQITEIGISLAKSMPFDQMLWVPGGSPTLCRPMNYVKTILVHLFPAILIDIILRLKGEKPFLTKIQRKIYEANLALQYFVLNDWQFRNDNLIASSKQLRLEDVKTFACHDAFDYDVILYLRYALAGVKRYLLRDKEENLPRNRIIYKRIKLLDRCLKSLPFIVAFYYIFVKLDFIHFCQSFFK